MVVSSLQLVDPFNKYTYITITNERNHKIDPSRQTSSASKTRMEKTLFLETERKDFWRVRKLSLELLLGLLYLFVARLPSHNTG